MLSVARVQTETRNKYVCVRLLLENQGAGAIGPGALLARHTSKDGSVRLVEFHNASKISPGHSVRVSQILAGMRELELTGYRQNDGQIIPFSGGVIKSRPLLRSVTIAAGQGLNEVLKVTRDVAAQIKPPLLLELRRAGTKIRQAARQLASTPMLLSGFLARTGRRHVTAFRTRLRSTKPAVKRPVEQAPATARSTLARIPARPKETGSAVYRLLESIETAIERWDASATASVSRSTETVRARMGLAWREAQQSVRGLSSARERFSGAFARVERRFALVAAIHRQLESMEVAIEHWDEAATESTTALMKETLEKWLRHPRFAAIYGRFKSLR